MSVCRCVYPSSVCVTVYTLHVCVSGPAHSILVIYTEPVAFFVRQSPACVPRRITPVPPSQAGSHIPGDMFMYCDPNPPLSGFIVYSLRLPPLTSLLCSRSSPPHYCHSLLPSATRPPHLCVFYTFVYLPGTPPVLCGSTSEDLC